MQCQGSGARLRRQMAGPRVVDTRHPGRRTGSPSCADPPRSTPEGRALRQSVALGPALSSFPRETSASHRKYQPCRMEFPAHSWEQVHAMRPPVQAAHPARLSGYAYTGWAMNRWAFLAAGVLGAVAVVGCDSNRQMITPPASAPAQVRVARPTLSPGPPSSPSPAVLVTVTYFGRAETAEMRGSCPVGYVPPMFQPRPPAPGVGCVYDSISSRPRRRSDRRAVSL